MFVSHCCIKNIKKSIPRPNNKKYFEQKNTRKSKNFCGCFNINCFLFLIFLLIQPGSQVVLGPVLDTTDSVGWPYQTWTKPTPTPHTKRRISSPTTRSPWSRNFPPQPPSKHRPT